jgi:endonuclease-3
VLSLALEVARPFSHHYRRKSIMSPSTRSRGSVATFLNGEAATNELFDSSATTPPRRSPFRDMKVSELKSQLKELNLPVSGVKMDLVARLEEHQYRSVSDEVQDPRRMKSKYFDTPEKASGSIDAVNESNTPIKSPQTPSRSSKKSPPKSSSKSPRKRPKIEPGSLQPPPNWERIYSLVTELRSDRTAPVDSDGAEALPQKHLGEVVYRFQVLIALMLSSQTKDAVVGETMRALQEHGLTVQNIRNTDAETLNSLIGKVGFHNNKTKFIKQAAEIIIEQYGGDIPSTAEELQLLPGVGPKMAFIVESIAFDRCSGIGVDTHMHRMFNDLKWVTSTTPEGTREQLEGWLPREKWGEVNYLWVGFGQETQQQKEKVLRKAIACSAPGEALRLMKKLKLDVLKEGKKFGLEDEIQNALEK